MINKKDVLVRTTILKDNLENQDSNVTGPKDKPRKNTKEKEIIWIKRVHNKKTDIKQRRVTRRNFNNKT